MVFLKYNFTIFRNSHENLRNSLRILENSDVLRMSDFKLISEEVLPLESPDVSMFCWSLTLKQKAPTVRLDVNARKKWFFETLKKHLGTGKTVFLDG